MEIKIVEEAGGKISYGYSLPGFSISDIRDAIDRRSLEFYYVDFARSDLQEEIDMLVSEGLLEEIGELNNKKRYSFSVPLQLSLEQCSNLNDNILDIMLEIFDYHRSPTKAEKNWLEFFYGNLEGSLQVFRHYRSSKKGRKRKSTHDIKQSMIRVHGKFENLIDSLNFANTKYRVFVQILLQYIYPAFMRKSFSSALLV